MLTDPAAARTTATAGPGTAVAEADPAPRSAEVYRSVHATKDFQRIRRRYRDFAFPAALGVMVGYLLYVILSVTAPGFMGGKLFGEVNVAFVFTVLELAMTVVIAQLFSRQAAAKRDETARRLRWVAQEALK
jgi:uncharacterized membrane protein (DUF485 family)